MIRGQKRLWGKHLKILEGAVLDLIGDEFATAAAPVGSGPAVDRWTRKTNKTIRWTDRHANRLSGKRKACKYSDNHIDMQPDSLAKNK